MKFDNIIYAIVTLGLVQTLVLRFALAAGGRGLTHDVCGNDADCRAPRQCQYVDASGSIVSCIPSVFGCLCTRLLISCNFTNADSDAQICPPGERCVKLAFDEAPIEVCISCTAFMIPSKHVILSKGNPKSCKISIPWTLIQHFDWPNMQTVPVQQEQGRNGDPCLSDDHCSRPRTCLSRHNIKNETSCSESDTDCICLDTRNLFPCSSQEECEDAFEQCATMRSADDEYTGICVSTVVIESSTNILTISRINWDTNDESQMGPGSGNNNANDDDKGACIAVEALQDMSLSRLVYGRHRRTIVLCDKWRSCATHGHIVDFHGRTMSMATYCSKHAVGKCRTGVMHVNSPKMERRLRIKTNSPGLTFTALAARYETKLEEIVLSTLSSLGF